MAQLKKGLWGGDMPSPNRTFGLAWGQGRGGATKLVHNAGWYNRAGEWLGWGDLSAGDIQRMCRELEEGELFVILSERDKKDSQDVLNVEYVVKHAMYIVSRGQLFFVDHHGFQTGDTVDGRGLSARVLREDFVRELLAETSAPQA